MNINNENVSCLLVMAYCNGRPTAPISIEGSHSHTPKNKLAKHVLFLVLQALKVNPIAYYIH